MELVKINDIRVKQVPKPKLNPQDIKGYDMFPELYANIYLCSKKKTGKTTVIYNILKKCMDKNTKLIIFCSTVEKDQTYKFIIEHFEKLGNIVITYHSIKDADVDQLDEILNELGKAEAQEEEKPDKKVKENNVCLFGDEEPEIKLKKKRKSKYIAPEYVFVFDDLSTELRCPSVNKLLKTNRHYKSKVILSSQWLKDIAPPSRRQLDYLLLFGGHTIEKLFEIHKELDLSIDFNQFIKLYKLATSKKYNFLYVNITDEQYRVNFNKNLIL